MWNFYIDSCSRNIFINALENVSFSNFVVKNNTAEMLLTLECIVY